MARLPTVGGDAGNWGDVLNDYLSQSHNADGSLKTDSVGAPQLTPNSVTNAAIADGTVAEAKLSSSVQTKLNAPATIADGSVTTDKLADGSVTNVKLAGAGTADGVATLDGGAKLPEAQVPDRLSPTSLGASYAARVETARMLKAEDVASALFNTPLPPDDRPTIVWSDGLTSSFASPVTVRPAIVGTGSSVSNWNSVTGTTDPNFFFDPGVFSTANGGSGDLEMHGDTKPGGASQAATWNVTFEFVTSETDAFEIGMYDSGSSGFVLEVGGIPVGFYVCPSGMANGKKVTITFPRSGRRHIRVAAVSKFYGIWLKTGQSIVKPSITRRVGAIIGDSYVGGAGGAYGLTSTNAATNRGVSQAYSYAPRLLKAMGANSYVLAGIGGTGIVAGSGTGSDYITRAAAVTGFNPSFLVITGSVNDPQSGAGVQSALEALLAATTSIPERYVMTVTRTGWEACDTAIRAAVAAHGNGVKIIEVSGILDGTGNTVSGGTGARGLFLMQDNSHPSYLGHEYILRQVLRQYFAVTS